MCGAAWRIVCTCVFCHVCPAVALGKALFGTRAGMALLTVAWHATGSASISICEVGFLGAYPLGLQGSHKDSESSTWSQEQLNQCSGLS